MNKKAFVPLWVSILISLIIPAVTALADSTYDGWWFIADQPGTGLSLEIQGNTMFAAIYTYDQGDPVWYSSAATYDASQKTYSGTLSIWTNSQGQDNDFLQPSPSDGGTFSMSFQSQDKAVMTYSVKNKTDSVTVNLSRFMPIASPGTPDNRIRGWWYDPHMNGIGIFLEAQGNTLFGAWYMYHSDHVAGQPLWFSFTGNFPAGSSNFSSPVTYWKNGSPIGVAPYKVPEAANAQGHELRLNLKADGGLDVNWSVNGKDTVFHMVRFRF